jgi:hypothetical protein
MGVAAATRARVRDDIVRLVHRGAGLNELSYNISRTLRRAVPFEGPCLLTMDPRTLLPTGEIVENGLPPPATVRSMEIELGEPDVTKFRALAHAAVPAAARQRRPIPGFWDRARPVPADNIGNERSANQLLGDGNARRQIRGHSRCRSRCRSGSLWDGPGVRRNTIRHRRVGDHTNIPRPAAVPHGALQRRVNSAVIDLGVGGLHQGRARRAQRTVPYQ